MSIFTTYIEWLERVCGKTGFTGLIYRSTLYIYQHVRHGCLSMISCIRSIGKPGKSSSVKLYYFNKEKNFGDELNLDLMRYFGSDYTVSSFESSNMICIGSILDNALLTDSKTLKYKKPLHVFGSGFIIEQEDESESFNRPVVIHSLRGKLTLERCEKMLGRKLPEVVLGDPGLLVNRIFPDLSPKNPCDVGIVCHFKDSDSPYLKNIRLADLKVKMLDVHLPAKEFLGEMTGCKLILSSSLHGLICADSFGIPNKAIIISGKVEGNGYKFRDYYSVFEDVEYSPVDLQENCITNDDLNLYRSQYKDLHEQIENICDRLDGMYKKIATGVVVK